MHLKNHLNTNYYESIEFAFLQGDPFAIAKF